MQAKVIEPKSARKSDTPWFTALWLGRDTEADEIIVALPDGVRKVRTIRRFSPSLQWRAEPLLSLQALPWKPNVSEAEITDFVYSDALEALQKPRSKAPAIVPEAEAPAEAPEELENPEVQELIEQSRGETTFDPQELSDQQREAIELQERPFQGTETSEPELPASLNALILTLKYLRHLRRYKGFLHCMLSRVTLRQYSTTLLVLSVSLKQH